MMRIVLVLLLTLLAAPIGEAQWAPFQASTTSSGGGGGTGNGGGPNLRQANVYGVPNSITPTSYNTPGIATQGVSTADYYNTDGFYSVRPFDLTSFGAEGTTIVAQQGRYYWPMSPDHPTGTLGNWQDGQDFKMAFSTDPQVLPTAINTQVAAGGGFNTSGNNNVANFYTTTNSFLYQLGFLYYDPEDTGNVFHWMGEGADYGSAGPGFSFTGTISNGSAVITSVSPNPVAANIAAGYAITGTNIPANTTIASINSSTQITMSATATGAGSSFTAHAATNVGHYATIMRSNDLFNWTLYGPGTINWGGNDFTSFQRPTRIGSGNWTSYSSTNYRGSTKATGSPGDTGIDSNGWRSLAGVSTSTDGLIFTRPEPASYTDTIVHVGTRRFSTFAYDPVTISGQQWIAAVEDARNVLITAANPAVVTKTLHGLIGGNTVIFNAPPTPSNGPFTADLMNGSNCLANVSPSPTGLIEAGNSLASSNVFYSSGPAIVVGIPANTTITAVGSCSGANSITMSANATMTVSGSPVVAFVLPKPLLQDQVYYVKTVLDADTFTVSAINGGTAIDTSSATANSCVDKTSAGLCNVPNDSMFASRVAVDTNMNILASPAPVRVSSAYSGIYPGPTYIQAVNSYAESGIYTYYVTRGFFNSATNFGFVNGATYANGGALGQQLVDIYSECIDPTLALCYAAAPMGVTASAAAGVVTLTWNNARPNQNYHLYYGFSPTSQPNLIGSITGLTTTYTPFLQVPATMYFKLVSLDNSGVEQGSRVVSAYVSSSTSFVNQHIARCLVDGHDPATIDRNKLDLVDAWITANGLHNSLENWASASFGVKQNTSGIMTKTCDLGTTRLPKYNDLWFCSSSPCTGASLTTYNPTGLGNAPAWVNGAANAFGVFGGLLDANNHNGRLNHIRRKVEISVFASYAKTSSSGDITLLGVSEFSGMHLQHLSGTPGTASFTLYDDTGTPQSQTLAIPSSATTPHVIGGTFGCGSTPAATCPLDTSPGSLNVYVDGTQGTTPTPTLHYNAGLSLPTTLKGASTGGALNFYVSGAKDSKFTYGAPSTYVMDDNSAGFTASDLIIFSKELTPTQAASLTALLQSFITPPTAIAYNITAMPSGASATCNTGTPADDSAAFTNFNTLAAAWDAANPSVPGSIVLNIPNSTCWFLQGGGGIYIVKGIVNHPVRIVGAGTSSKLSDGGTGGGFFAGAVGQPVDNLHDVRTASVSKGSTTIDFTACPGAGCSAALALFSPGAPVELTGIDLQGSGASPSNPGFWDFLTVATVTTTGVTVTTPVTHDYKSTWPNYGPGGAFATDPGGPATLYALDPSWPLRVEYNQVIIDQVGNQTNCRGLSCTFKNASFTGTACAISTENGTFALINSVMTSCGIEIDKNVDLAVIQNTTALNGVAYQSSSVKQSIISRANITNFLNGGGSNMIIANSTLASWSPGAYSYGSSYGRTYLLGNTITAFSPLGVSQIDINSRGVWSGGTMTVPQDITVSAAANSGVTGWCPGGGCMVITASNAGGTAGWTNGIIADLSGFPVGTACVGGTFAAQVIDGTHLGLIGSTFTSTCTGGFGNLPLPWAIPGANVYFGIGPMFQVADLAVGANNSTVVSFNQNGSLYAGGFPTVPLSGGFASVVVHPAPQYFGAGNTGPNSVTLNPPVQGAPLGSYYTQVITAATGNPASPIVPYIWGQMTETDWTITAACSAASNFEFVPTNFIRTIGSSSTSGTWSPTANAQTANAAPRQMFPTTTAGSQSGDSLTAPGANTWLVVGQQNPAYGTVANCGSASMTVTIQTDQGVVNPAQQ